MARFQYQPHFEPLFSEAATTSSAAQGDSGVVFRTRLLQYAALVAPVLVAATALTVEAAASSGDVPRAPLVTHAISVVGPVSVPLVFDTNWTPVYPDRLDRAKPRLEGFQVEPEFVPDVTNPVTPNSWTPRYPSRHIYRRPVEFPAWAAPSFVPDVTQPVTGIAWKASYPDFARKRTLAAAQRQALAWNTDTPAVVVERGGPNDSGILPRTKLLQYASVVGPVSITAVAGFDPQYLPPSVFPSRVPRKFKYAPYEPLHRVFIVPVEVPVMSWESYTGLEAVPVRRKGIHASRQTAWFFDRFDAPTVESFDPALKRPAAYFPDRIARKRLAEFQPFFWSTHTPAAVAETLVPGAASDSGVLRSPFVTHAVALVGPVWTAAPTPFDPALTPRVSYPSRLVRKFNRAIYVQYQPMFGVEVDVPVMAWEGYTNLYPGRVPARKRSTPPSFFWSTNTPAEAAPFDPALFPRGTYPDRVPSKKLHPSLAPFWWMDRFDAPAPPAFDPQYLPQAYYPARLDRKVTRQQGGRVGPAHVLPPFISEWKPTYPDRLVRTVVRQQAGHFGLSAVVPPLVSEWGPTYPVRTPRRIDQRNLPSGAVAPLVRTYRISLDSGLWTWTGSANTSLRWTGLVGGGTNTRLGFRLIVQDDEEDYFK